MNKGRKIPLQVVRDGLDVLDNSIVRVGDKPHGVYMFACTMSIEEKGRVTLLSRGRNNSKAIDILEHLKKQNKEKGRELKTNFSTHTQTLKEGISETRVSVLKIEVQRT